MELKEHGASKKMDVASGMGVTEVLDGTFKDYGALDALHDWNAGAWMLDRMSRDEGWVGPADDVGPLNFSEPESPLGCGGAGGEGKTSRVGAWVGVHSRMCRSMSASSGITGYSKYLQNVP